MHETNDFIAGTIGGVAGMLLEYPFDTVKVLLQSYDSSRYNGYVDCAVKLYRSDGFMGFYRGVTARLVASGFEHACVFVSYKWTLRKIGADVDRPTVLQIFIGGCGSGVASALCLTPFELVKCRMQADDGVVKRHYHGSWDCAKQIYRQGGIRGLYKGGSATLMREIPGTAAWCGTYDFLRARMTAPGESPKDLPAHKLMFAGGCAGVAFWTILFPADVVKTRIQVDSVYAQYTVWKALREVYREGGVRALYRGYTLTALRSFPSNAIIFFCFDSCTRLLEHQERKWMLTHSSTASSTMSFDESRAAIASMEITPASSGSVHA